MSYSDTTAGVTAGLAVTRLPSNCRVPPPVGDTGVRINSSSVLTLYCGDCTSTLYTTLLLGLTQNAGCV